MKMLDCIIIGAGPAGIGVGAALQDLGIRNFTILDRSEIGASFRLWPSGMRLITPSFTTNAYGMLDLNAPVLQTSPAYTLGTEHPTGQEYADFLEKIVDYKKLPVETDVDCLSVVRTEAGFRVETSKGVRHTRFVIWAAGEYQYPRIDGFPGSEYCQHNSLIEEWKDVDGEEVLIIGGYESGADAAIQLSKLGKKVTVIDKSERWTAKGSSDPSMELSPFTKDRLREIESSIELLSGYEVHWIEPDMEGGYLVYVENKDGENRFLKTKQAPILATGFKGSVSLIEPLFEMDSAGKALLTTEDESTITPGLYLTGPSVNHGNLLFCFIYKFRQRFAVIASSIGTSLGLDLSPLDNYRKEGMFLDDLSCCGEDCQC